MKRIYKESLYDTEQTYKSEIESLPSSFEKGIDVHEQELGHLNYGSAELDMIIYFKDPGTEVRFEAFTYSGKCLVYAEEWSEITEIIKERQS